MEIEFSVTTESDELSTDNSGIAPRIAKTETLQVLWSRSLVFAVLAISAALSGYLSYHLTKQKNEQNFESEVSFVFHSVITPFLTGLG